MFAQGLITNISAFDPKFPKKPRKFEILCEEDSYMVSHDGFFPVQEFDVIYTHLHEPGKNDLYYKLGNHPFVVVSDDDRSTKNTFKKCIPKNLFRKIDELYDDLESYSGTLSVANYLSGLAGCHYRYKLGQGSKIACPELDCLNEKGFLIFLEKFTRHHLRRQLWLLGLNDGAINKIAETVSLEEIYPKILANPYKMVKISMEICDRITMSIKGELDPIQQLGGKLLRILDGFLNEQKWVFTPHKIVNQHVPNYLQHLEYLQTEFGIQKVEDRVYLEYPLQVETFIYNKIKNMISSEFIPLEEIEIEPHCNEDQKNAVIGCLSNAVSIIRGGPGTGKTTTIKQIINNLENHNIKFLLCSFTGNSAERINELTGREDAVTVDYFIYNPFGGVKYVILDEFSMTTYELLYRLFQVVPDANLVLVGDPFQLPPISWGNSVNAFIGSEIPTFELLINYRTGDDSDIIYNAKVILDAVGTDVRPKLKLGKSFHLIEGDIADIGDLVIYFKEEGYSVEDFRIISPFNKSIDSLNQMVNEIYFGDADEREDDFGKTWKLGQLVMPTKNNYPWNFKNGQKGIVSKFGSKDGYSFITVKFRKHSIDFYTEKNDEIEALGLPTTGRYLTSASAITVHKSQGSEYKFVVFYIPPYPRKPTKTGFLNYLLVNTAITRPQKEIFIVGDLYGFWDATKKLPIRTIDYLPILFHGSEESSSSGEYDIDVDIDFSEYE